MLAKCNRFTGYYVASSIARETSFRQRNCIGNFYCLRAGKLEFGANEPGRWLKKRNTNHDYHKNGSIEIQRPRRFRP